MKLYEEYLARHGLKIPVVNHCTNGSVFLQRDRTSKYNYSFLKIFWVENPRGPGNYVITHLCPIRDGFHQQGHIFDRISSVNVYWDQYEDYLLDWIATNIQLEKTMQPVPSERCLFAAWEMFVYIFDSWFNNQPQSIKTVLFDTLDEDNSHGFRTQSYKEICNYMSVNTPAILKIWREEILIWVGFYSGWLSKLIEIKCLENTPQLESSIP